jgi:hypothetical protein
MGLSDFPCSFVIVSRPWTYRCVLKALAAFGRTRDLSTSLQDVSPRARVTDRAGLRPSLQWRWAGCCRQGVGILKPGVFRGSITWPVVPPVSASYPALRPCRKTRSRRR